MGAADRAAGHRPRTLAVYVGLGVLALLQFAMSGLIDPLLIVYLFLFFLMSYLVYGALMQTIGAAVNQMADAQSLMGPLMMLLVLPYILTAFIGGQPDATFSVVLSFVPPVNAFVMMARLASQFAATVWQVLLSLGVSLVAATFTVWFAAKVFRIGLLMHGKPPSFATLHQVGADELSVAQRWTLRGYRYSLRSFSR